MSSTEEFSRIVKGLDVMSELQALNYMIGALSVYVSQADFARCCYGLQGFVSQLKAWGGDNAAK